MLVQGFALRNLMSLAVDQMDGRASGFALPGAEALGRLAPARSSGRRDGPLAFAPPSWAWRVLGVLFLIGAEAMLYGFSYPFFSLALEKHGLSSWLIGLNASLAGAGILIIGPFLPRLIAAAGLRQLVASLFLISFLSFGAILAADQIVVWFVARFIMGACFAALWSTTEIWLNGIVEDRHRGRIIGASGTLYAAAQFLGPLSLSATGVTGMLPLITAMIPLGMAVVVALSIRSPEGSPKQETETGDRASLRLALTLAGPLIAAAFLAGILETAMQSLLPIFGLAHGLTDAGASRLVAMFSLGEAVLVALLGYAADRYGRRRTLQLCAVLASVVMVLLPLSIVQIGVLGPTLFIAGGAISGLYTLGVIQIGQEFRGQRLAVVSTGFAMAYAAGAVVGSTPMGLAIDLFGPNALPIIVSCGFLIMALSTFLRRSETRAAAPTTAVARAAERWGILPARAGGQALHVDQGEAIDIEQAEIGDLQMWDDRQRKEGDLEEWFRQRTAELARRRAERNQRAANRLERLQAHQAGERQRQFGTQLRRQRRRRSRPSSRSGG